MIRPVYRLAWLLVFLLSCGDNIAGFSALQLSSEGASIEIKERLEVEATLTVNQKRQVADQTTWETSDSAIVSIDGDGEKIAVVGVKAGTATITAHNLEFSASIDITVKPAHVVSVTISPAGTTIPAGFTQAFTLMATFNDDSVEDVTSQATWSIDDTDLATVDAAGVVTGQKVGDAIVTGMFSGLDSSTHVAVTKAVLQSIVVTPTTPTSPKGVATQFTATGHFSDNTTSNITQSVTWGSSLVAIATVTTAGTRGVATGIAEGDTTISATSGLISDSTTFHVTAASVVSIAVSTNPAIAGFPIIPLTADVQFVATALLSDATSIDVTTAVTWASTTTAAVTINVATGFADAHGIGASTITATQGVIVGTVDVDVQLAAVPATDFIPVAGYDTVVAGGFGGTPAVEAVRFSDASSFLYVGSETGGFIRASVDASNVIAFLTPPPEVTNLKTLGIAPHTFGNNGAVMSMADPTNGSNWSRNNAGSGASLPTTDVFDSSGTTRAFLYIGRFEGGVGAVVGGWDPTSGTAVMYAGGGNGSPPAVPTRRALTATGTARGLSSSPLIGTASNIWISVFALQPDNVTQGTGGLFQSADKGVTWVEHDGGLNSDRDLVRSVVVDQTVALAGNTIWAAVDGPGRVYKTTNGNTAAVEPVWAQAAGSTTDFTKRIPNKAKVKHVFITKQDANTLFAATDIGLYKTTDGGANWTLAGFQGRSVRAVQQSGTSTLIVVGVADSVGLYRTP